MFECAAQLVLRNIDDYIMKTDQRKLPFTNGLKYECTCMFN